MKKSNEPRTLTEAQINANRRNSQKSTGPRSAEGKTASSRNRLVHGLRANKHILLDEDPEEFLFLLKDLYDRFQPAGDGEEKLVLRIASDQWRIDRSFPMEAGIYRERLQVVAARDQIRQRDYTQHKRNHESRPETVPRGQPAAGCAMRSRRAGPGPGRRSSPGPSPRRSAGQRDRGRLADPTPPARTRLDLVLARRGPRRRGWLAPARPAARFPSPGGRAPRSRRGPSSPL